MKQELIEFVTVSIVILLLIIILYLGFIGAQVLQMQKDCEQIGVNGGAMNFTNTFYESYSCDQNTVPNCIEIKGSVYCKQK